MGAAKNNDKKKDEQQIPGKTDSKSNENDLILSELLENLDTQDDKEAPVEKGGAEELDFEKFADLDYHDVVLEDDYDDGQIPEHPVLTPSNELNITADEIDTPDYASIINEIENEDENIAEIQNELDTDLSFAKAEPGDDEILLEDIPEPGKEPEEGNPLYEEPEFPLNELNNAMGTEEESDTRGAGQPAVNENVSYKEFIISDPPKGPEEDHSGSDSATLATNPADAFSIEIGDEPKAATASGLSYTEYILDDSAGENPIEPENAPEPEKDNGLGMENEEPKFDKEEFILDETDMNLEENGEELSLESTEAEEKQKPETPARASGDEGIVVSGGDMGDEIEHADDFLGLDDMNKPADDSFLGVAEVKEQKLPEIMLEGIEMDAEEQTKMVTRAELLLSQGKKDKAVEIYTKIAEKKGVTPFVAKRLKQLNITYQRVAPEGQPPGGK
jgi:hypothetical protein